MPVSQPTAGEIISTKYKELTESEKIQVMANEYDKSTSVVNATIHTRPTHSLSIVKSYTAHAASQMVTLKTSAQRRM